METCSDRNVKKRAVIEKYHQLLKDADRLFHESEGLVDRNTLLAIKYAIKSLEKSIELYRRGTSIYYKANLFLDVSRYNECCNRNCYKCKKILEDSLDEYDKEERDILRTINILNYALKSLKDSIDHRKKGCKLYQRYKRCVHNKY